jgi:hypothetical protein
MVGAGGVHHRDQRPVRSVAVSAQQDVAVIGIRIA